MSFWKKLGNVAGYVAAPFTAGASLALTEKGQNLISNAWDKFTGVAQTRETNQANAEEAQKNRDWQEMMANTAHQREKEDYIRAGLNPAAAAQTGAETGPGAQATMQSAPSGADTMSKIGNTINAVSGGINSIAAAAKTFSENKYVDEKTKAEISNIAADTTVKGAQATETQTRTQNLQADTEKKNAEIQNVKKQYELLSIEEKKQISELTAIKMENLNREKQAEIENAFYSTRFGQAMKAMGLTFNEVANIIPFAAGATKKPPVINHNYNNYM